MSVLGVMGSLEQPRARLLIACAILNVVVLCVHPPVAMTVGQARLMG
jgi:hypothetical protein